MLLKYWFTSAISFLYRFNACDSFQRFQNWKVEYVNYKNVLVNRKHLVQMHQAFTLLVVNENKKIYVRNCRTLNWHHWVKTQINITFISDLHAHRSTEHFSSKRNFWTKAYLYDNSPRNFLSLSCNLMGACKYPSPPNHPPGNQRWQCQGEVSSVRQFLEQISSRDVQIKTCPRPFFAL